ncbi:transposase (fragment) [Xenorhabdus bovienii str. Intermedium]|uniref:Transposase n=2 Tax=Xenorhabdus bovienii TaxID=40576 RepID=A0A077QBV8_XENBV
MHLLLGINVQRKNGFIKPHNKTVLTDKVYSGKTLRNHLIEYIIPYKTNKKGNTDS